MRRGSRTGRNAGFTMMEAIISLLLLMLAVLGTGALAAATVRSNMAAKDRTQATNLADKMLGMMRTEAMGWNAPTWNPTQDVEDPGIYMPLLSRFGVGAATGTTGYAELTQQFGPVQAFTRELDPVAPNAVGAKFCVHYALTWLQPNETMRADVRVYWMRRGSDPDPYSFYSNCGLGNVDLLGRSINDIRCVSRSAVLPRNVHGGRL